ncbi:MAG: hypothetical protein HZA61_03770 [Candidatus Eisenbacteria bacterium]|uniref:Periplasmic heavy metal sensor n=1 Tax=Eiseniibacteriota bacterium TaxID=2212470 RepID=A0A933S9S6_UNCEI|nr:hypothetical protein [Candidatus Eisenbacteria bacterium]
MRPCACFFASLALVAGLSATAAVAAESGPVLPTLTGAPTQAPLGDPAAVRALEALPLPKAAARQRPAATPLLSELFDVLDREDAQVAALQAELARTADPMAALAVQRRIEKVKQDSEVELLRVQATHARAAGKSALAAQLDAAIAELTAPRAAHEPVERPAPAREDVR